MTDATDGARGAGRRRRHRRVTRSATGGAEQSTGDGLDQTRDDTDTGWGERPESGDAQDRWYLEQRPPHWG